jgi:uncharacterized protein YbbC (DUF1343 family)
MVLMCRAGPGRAEDLAPRVLNGVDVLRREGFASISGKRVGLITNHTGVADDGTSTIDLLFHSGRCTLAALFSPEHGIRGDSDRAVDSTVDSATGVPVHSLYGETRRPTQEMLRGIDVLVYDIQDIGARFYTYATTLGYAMEEAARAKIPIYVLDRPNPLGGARVEGPMLDPDRRSFTGYMPLPVRHGLTSGELAQYFNAEGKIGAELRVVRMEGWRRDQYFDETGQVWVNPSPNMRSLLAAILYPGVCLLEPTNVSVGRGTDRPFEVLGAPWIEPRRLAAALNGARLPGVRFVAVTFTPASSVHQGARCGGVNLLLTDRAVFNSVLTGLTLVATLRALYPRTFEIEKVLRLLGNRRALDALEAGLPAPAVLRAARPDVQAFLARRRKALLYGGSRKD